jgi:hypothetical protein
LAIYFHPGQREEVKLSVCEAEHHPSSRAEVKKAPISTKTSPFFHMVWWLFKHRNRFASLTAAMHFVSQNRNYETYTLS